ncbi:polysaccharide lyase family 7 protein [Algibacter mikhailovii]|nr:polysaccharide lyase family 7 protein [Algibacter mikhailovii]
MKNNKQNQTTAFTFLIVFICVFGPLRAQVPSDLMDNCKQWKITYPTGVEDKTLCGEANNEYFYVNGAKDAIVFRTPIRTDNGTTPNSSYIRSELRELEADGGGNIYWTTEGSHLIYVKQAITHLPMNKSHLVATQIHGNKDDGIDDSMVLRLEDRHLFLSFNGNKLRDDLTIKTNYALGTIHEVVFLIEDGKHYCYYSEDGNLKTAFNSGNAASYLIKDGANDYVMDLDYDETYFKVGNYTQSNSEREGTDSNDPNNYGEVLVYDFYVEHDASHVTGVSLLPSTVDLSIGGTYQLSEVISPSSATNKGVSFSSSNALVASVNSSTGLVTGVKPGKAIITVTSDEGGFTATSTITVVEDPSGINLALNKPVTGTGTHHEDNELGHLVDGLTSTRWSVSGFPQTAVIDLGAVYALGRTEMVCYTDRAYKYTVSVSSTENGIYTEIVDRSDNTTPGTELNPIIDVFSGTNGRFVKITVTGAEYYTGSWVSLLEFRAYEAASLGVENDLDSKENVVLWPNPAGNTIHIQGAEAFNTLAVYDMVGKLIFKRPYLDDIVDLSQLNPGLYIFRLSNASKTINKRIVKK